MPFHVVCHDCTFEAVADHEEAADLGTYLHAADTEHNVEFAEVA